MIELALCTMSLACLLFTIAMCRAASEADQLIERRESRRTASDGSRIDEAYNDAARSVDDAPALTHA